MITYVLIGLLIYVILAAICLYLIWVGIIKEILEFLRNMRG